MKSWSALAGVVAMIAAPAQAEPKIDIHALVRGQQGARFVKGIPTLEMPMKLGAVQVRPLGFDHHDTVFAVAVFNGGSEPANIALDDMHASVDGAPVRIWTGNDLARQAKNRATWAQVGIAFLSAAGSAFAASERSTYRSSLSTPYGSYSYRSSYPSLSGQLLANDIATNGAMSMAIIQERLDMALANIDASVVQRTTVDPRTAYGAIVVVDKVDYGKAPLELNLSIDWNGESYPFAFLLTRAGQAAPPQYTAVLAENTKPMALDQRWLSRPGGTSTPTAASAARPAEGPIFLSSGAVQIPAHTKSGYCLKVPADYVATGALNSPVITGAMPRCEDVQAKPKQELWRPLGQN